MSSLFARLSIALVVIVGIMGSTLFLVARNNTQLYYEELTQRLNAPIGMYVTEQQVLIREGIADVDSLKVLADHAMVINPSAEIYLLDRDGHILAHGLPDASVMRTTVDLEPVQALIDGTTPMPIRGDDPRATEGSKVFSAAPVMSENGLEGYLYVVLGGQRYDALASDLGELYVARSSMFAALLTVATGAIIALLVFGLLTRRLHRLAREVRHLGNSERPVPEPLLLHDESSGDEIDQVSYALDVMSATIAGQVKQLKENDRLRRELVANITHDLNTPLSAMRGYIETLLVKNQQLDDATRKRYLEIAHRHVVRLGSLVADLFELAKLDSASVTPSLEAFSLSELVHDIALEFKLDAERRGIRLIVEHGNSGTMTLGDIGLIQRVLENLVNNAVRFTPSGGEITLEISERSQSVAIAVSDTGPGIPEPDIPRIFDRFFRAEHGEEARSISSGLGLAIVKRILELHESTITVTSRMDVGTRFEFELPRLQQAA
jgi:signal transduction histidine kinase